ncbi:hypothetical protein VNO77_16923 [Canavalia gladiata]|uniref:Uncharacterized protein n=1 Tax=Canavalia gladiata TaxID=3824 RepID=A0AAN9LMW7_CANGL
MLDLWSYPQFGSHVELGLIWNPYHHGVLDEMTSVVESSMCPSIPEHRTSSWLLLSFAGKMYSAEKHCYTAILPSSKFVHNTGSRSSSGRLFWKQKPAAAKIGRVANGSAFQNKYAE